MHLARVRKAPVLSPSASLVPGAERQTASKRASTKSWWPPQGGYDFYNHYGNGLNELARFLQLILSAKGIKAPWGTLRYEPCFQTWDKSRKRRVAERLCAAAVPGTPACSVARELDLDANA